MIEFVENEAPAVGARLRKPTTAAKVDGTAAGNRDERIISR
jgi:hypothetical protein